MFSHTITLHSPPSSRTDKIAYQEFKFRRIFGQCWRKWWINVEVVDEVINSPSRFAAR